MKQFVEMCEKLQLSDVQLETIYGRSLIFSASDSSQSKIRLFIISTPSPKDHLALTSFLSQLMALPSCPNLLPVRAVPEVGVETHVVAVTEWTELNLAQDIEWRRLQRNHYPETSIVAIAQSVLAVLEVMRRAGLPPGSISPSNIFIRRSGEVYLFPLSLCDSNSHLLLSPFQSQSPASSPDLLELGLTLWSMSELRTTLKGCVIGELSAFTQTLSPGVATLVKAMFTGGDIQDLYRILVDFSSGEAEQGKVLPAIGDI